MRTEFSLDQLADAAVQESERVLRACVHCGFCLSSCPTYTLLGDELDSPRGRIYLIKDMLEGNKKPTAKTVKHLDRCLSCLACESICPSNVTYMHLIDHARTYIARHYRRPPVDALIRNMLGRILVSPKRFKVALALGRLGRPFGAVMPKRLRAMLTKLPNGKVSDPITGNQVIKAEGARTARVAVLMGCVQQAVGMEINEATIRILTRHGCEVVLLHEANCCGAISHHLGQEKATLARVKANIDEWTRQVRSGPLDAIVVNASGCGTMVKDYGFLLREDPEYAEKAAKVSALAKDVSEYLATLDLKPKEATRPKVVYQSACSLRHGQRVEAEPIALLEAAGFAVAQPKEPHMCCGSAGTYNLLQPEIAGRLLERKVEMLGATGPEIIASGNIGCMTQLRTGTDIPIVHTVELLDWATGGPKPAVLDGER